jgi:hypothetical protein
MVAQGTATPYKLKKFQITKQNSEHDESTDQLFTLMENLDKLIQNNKKEIVGDSKKKLQYISIVKPLYEKTTKGEDAEETNIIGAKATFKFNVDSKTGKLFTRIKIYDGETYTELADNDLLYDNVVKLLRTATVKLKLQVFNIWVSDTMWGPKVVIKEIVIMQKKKKASPRKYQKYSERINESNNKILKALKRYTDKQTGEE